MSSKKPDTLLAAIKTSAGRQAARAELERIQRAQDTWRAMFQFGFWDFRGNKQRDTCGTTNDDCGKEGERQREGEAAAEAASCVSSAGRGGRVIVSLVRL